MKIWKIEAYIESEDEICRKDILKKIYNDFNTGDGLYLETEKNFSLRLVKKAKEEEYLEDPLD
jgi:hypothetical protein